MTASRRREADALTRIMRAAHRPEPPPADLDRALADIGRRARRSPAPRAGTLRRWSLVPVVLVVTAATLTLAINARGDGGAPAPPSPERAAAVPRAAPAPSAHPPRRPMAAGRPRGGPAPAATPLGRLELLGDPGVRPALGPVEIGGRRFRDGWRVPVGRGAALHFRYRIDTRSGWLDATVGASGVARCVWTLRTDEGAPELVRTVRRGQAASIRLRLDEARTVGITVAAAGARTGGADPACLMGDARVGRSAPPAAESGSPAASAAPTAAPPPPGTPSATPSGGRESDRRTGAEPSPTPAPDRP
ncbi:hypothetical protein [Actinomadura chibensis]|uniref:Uncharacterized protein n=1 Tax=Actinomadura chibensis TaxID=392828 RepID=A0A5D0NBN0_9ACTN|nr:hypothetical protein [Actinomadura chibensis]TYB41736.1 hypothetical protein FXF69_32875 [Actinomadura chibensis]